MPNKLAKYWQKLNLKADFDSLENKFNIKTVPFMELHLFSSKRINIQVPLGVEWSVVVNLNFLEENFS